jgi:hypothetical protein
MEWFFEGLGTFLVGLVIGGTGGHVITRKVMKQRQKARDGARQVQIGGDVRGKS